jgi:hypothetical protein
MEEGSGVGFDGCAVGDVEGFDVGKLDGRLEGPPVGSELGIEVG